MNRRQMIRMTAGGILLATGKQAHATVPTISFPTYKTAALAPSTGGLLIKVPNPLGKPDPGFVFARYPDLHLMIYNGVEHCKYTCKNGDGHGIDVTNPNIDPVHWDPNAPEGPPPFNGDVTNPTVSPDWWDYDDPPQSWWDYFFPKGQRYPSVPDWDYIWNTSYVGWY